MRTLKMILVLVSIAGLIVSSGCAHKNTPKTAKAPAKEGVAKPLTNAPSAKITAPVTAKAEPKKTSPALAPKAQTTAKETTLAIKPSTNAPTTKVTTPVKTQAQAQKTSPAPKAITKTAKTTDTKVKTVAATSTSSEKKPKQTKKATTSKPTTTTAQAKTDKTTTDQSKVAQPVKTPVTKEERLAALLDDYKADKITAKEYHQSRAKIIAEP